MFPTPWLCRWLLTAWHSSKAQVYRWQGRFAIHTYQVHVLLPHPWSSTTLLCPVSSSALGKNAVPLCYLLGFVTIKGNFPLSDFICVWGLPCRREKLIPRQKGTWLALFPIPWGGNRQETWVTVAVRDLQCNVEAVTSRSGSSLPQFS